MPSWWCLCCASPPWSSPPMRLGQRNSPPVRPNRARRRARIHPTARPTVRSASPCAGHRRRPSLPQPSLPQRSKSSPPFLPRSKSKSRRSRTRRPHLLVEHHPLPSSPRRPRLTRHPRRPNLIRHRNLHRNRHRKPAPAGRRNSSPTPCPTLLNRP